jgi:hypothetical protein
LVTCILLACRRKAPMIKAEKIKYFKAFFMIYEFMVGH